MENSQSQKEYQFIPNITKFQRETHSIRYLCMFEPACAVISLNSLSRSSAKVILNSLVPKNPPYSNLGFSQPLYPAAEFHWLCVCVSNELQIKLNMDYLLLYFEILEKSRYKYSISFINLIEQASQILSKGEFLIPQTLKGKLQYENSYSNSEIFYSDTKTISISKKDFESFLILSTQFPALFRALYPYIYPMIQKIDINLAFDCYAYSVLPIMNSNELNASKITFSNDEELCALIQRTILDFRFYNHFFPDGTPTGSDCTLLFKIQNDFFEKNQFPNRTFFNNFSLHTSLMNTSLVTRTHFIDVCWYRCKKMFLENDDNSALDSFSLIPELKRWSLIAIYELKHNQQDINFLRDTIPKFLLQISDKKQNIASNFLERIVNDDKLLITFNQITGRILSFSDGSLPFLLETAGMSVEFDQIEGLYNTELFYTTDEDRNIDCDYLSSQFLLINELKCIQNQIAGEKFFSNLNSSFELVSRMEMRDRFTSVLIDLFSLLFVTDKKTGEFVCNSETAHKILSAFSNYEIEEPFLSIFTRSIKKVQIANILFPNDHNLNHILVPDTYLFNHALISHDWSIAQQLEGDNQQFKQKRKLFKGMFDYINKKQLDTDSIPLKIEIFLTDISTNIKIDSEMVKQCEEWSNIIEEVNVLITNSTRDFLVSFAEENDQIIQYLSPKLVSLTSSSWTKTNLNLKSTWHLSKFFLYLDMFIPSVLELNLAETVYDSLLIDSQEIIYRLYKSNNKEIAQQLSNSLKLDLNAVLINHSKEINEKIPLLNDYSIVNLADSLFSNQFDNINDQFINQIKKVDHSFFEQMKSPFQPKKSFSKTKIEKKLNQPINIHNYDNFDFSQYDNIFYLNNVPTEYYEKKLIDLISSEHLDIESISELSYNVSSDFFDELFKLHLDKLDLNTILTICSISNCSDKLSESVQLLIDVSKNYQPVFPLENSFKHLLLTGSFKLASQMCRLFRFQMKASKILREVILSFLYDNKSVKLLLQICPELSTEIIESLPVRFKEKVLQDQQPFFDAIPKTWKKLKNPKMMLIMNLADDENAYSIFQRFPFLNLDSELLSLFRMPTFSIEISLSALDKIELIARSLKKLLKFFRNPYEVCQLIFKQLVNLISQITVNRNELLIETVMHRLSSIFNETNDILNNYFTIELPNKKLSPSLARLLAIFPNTCKYVKVLNNFVSCFFNTKFDIQYNFSNFESIDKISQFVNICFFYDFPTVAIQFINTWKFNELLSTLDKYALNIFVLGRYEDGLKLAADRRLKKSLNTMNIVNSFVDACTYSQLFDQSAISKLSDISDDEFKQHSYDNSILDFITHTLNLNYQNLINSTIRESLTKDLSMLCISSTMNEASIWASRKYLKLKAPLFMRVTRLVINGNFDKALKLVMGKNFPNQKKSQRIIQSQSMQFMDGTINASTKFNRSISLEPLNSEKMKANQDLSNESNQNNSQNRQQAVTFSREINHSVTSGQINSQLLLNQFIESNSNSNEFNSSGLKLSASGSQSSIQLDLDSENSIYFNNNLYKSLSFILDSNSTELNETNTTIQDRWTLFLENVFVVSISYSYFSKMKVKLIEFDPQLKFFGSLVEKLLKDSIKNSMPHLEFELEMFLGRSDSAVITAISLFQKDNSIINLENALKAVTKELNMRKSNTKTTPASIPMNDIERYSKLIPLQLKFMKFIQRRGFDSSLNENLSLFHNEKSADSMVLFLFSQCNFKLAIEIIQRCDLDMHSIADSYVVVLLNEKNENCLKFIKELEMSSDRIFFEQFFNRMMLTLIHVIEEEEQALAIIQMADINEEFRTKILIQFGEFEKAFENAKKWKLFDLMPLIAHEALIKDPRSIALQINYSISNCLAKNYKSPSQDF